MNKQSIILLGSGGFGREVAAWIKTSQLPCQVTGFLDDEKSGDAIIGPIQGHTPLPSREHDYLTCFGAGKARHKVRTYLEKRGARFTTVIFPEVTSASGLSETTNSIFLGACSIANNVTLGDDLLIQGFAIIGHDTTLGDGCTVSSHAFVGGWAKLGKYCTIHPHAVVLPHVEIGEGAVVGAGSVVIRNVPPYASVFGAPAKIITQATSDD